eukprot:CAMPEP_0170411032 /NCGR_PEP_ID=MMETSP0117_2-20130122/30209_1 /TAXON_ID=400756 /ORGANISM="Durinskia baltica, Strain CSIRO CS-38" /LENGTH=142 /DNA_ID=CAMNT_0010668609 /DNA_START=300 /DNA_END=725 /DNA_ORIENTATION=+
MVVVPMATGRPRHAPLLTAAGKSTWLKHLMNFLYNARRTTTWPQWGRPAGHACMSSAKDKLRQLLNAHLFDQAHRAGARDGGAVMHRARANPPWAGRGAVVGTHPLEFNRAAEDDAVDPLAELLPPHPQRRDERVLPLDLEE